MSGRMRVLLSVVGAMLAVRAVPANAGCGCDKAPPPPAQVRPAFASPGDKVTLFGSGLRKDRDHVVFFRSGSTVKTASGKARRRRDFGDGVEKTQLTVTVPSMPLGPTSISVWEDGDKRLEVSSSSFTMLQAPIAFTEETSRTVATCYRAAVGADGTMYLPVDIGAVADRMVFNGLGDHYPLVFGPQDVVIYNTQGVLMQLLNSSNTEIYEIEDAGADASFALTYDRHEFVTYRAAHVHEGRLALDPSDPVWHADGTRHVDHDHLVLAISGRMRDGSRPAPGKTPAFELDVITAIEADGPVATRTIAWGDCGGSSTSSSNSGSGSSNSGSGSSN